jgi:hypothetical protein
VNKRFIELILLLMVLDLPGERADDEVDVNINCIGFFVLDGDVDRM